MKLREIGSRFGIGESALAQASRRLQVRTGEDNELEQWVEEFRSRLDLSRMKP